MRRTSGGAFYHVGPKRALLYRLEKEARRLPVILFYQTAVCEHRRQVIGKYAPVKRDQVRLYRRLSELLRLLLVGGWNKKTLKIKKIKK